MAPSWRSPLVSDTATLINLPWRSNAACKGLDPSIFYPVTDEEAETAKSVCELCPVQSLCPSAPFFLRGAAPPWERKPKAAKKRARPVKKHAGKKTKKAAPKRAKRR